MIFRFGNVFLSDAISYNNNIKLDDNELSNHSPLVLTSIIAHELGHYLGLAHPFVVSCLSPYVDFPTLMCDPLDSADYADGNFLKLLSVHDRYRIRKRYDLDIDFGLPFIERLRQSGYQEDIEARTVDYKFSLYFFKPYYDDTNRLDISFDTSKGGFNVEQHKNMVYERFEFDIEFHEGEIIGGTTATIAAMGENGNDGNSLFYTFNVPVFDQDNDGYWADNDNCADIFNPAQTNSDGDDDGDACDLDDDNDGVPDEQDAFPLDPNETSDLDGDGVGDNSDNCPGDHNPGQEDSDGNGIGDACEIIAPSCGGPFVIDCDDFEYDDSLDNHGWIIIDGSPSTGVDPQDPNNRVAHLDSQANGPTPGFRRDLGDIPLELGMELSISFFDTGDNCNNCDTEVRVYFDGNTKSIAAGYYNNPSHFDYSYRFPTGASHLKEPYGLRGYGWHTFKWVVDHGGGIDFYIDGRLVINDLMEPGGAPATTLSGIRAVGGSDPFSYSFSVDDYYLRSAIDWDDFEYDDSLENHGWVIDNGNPHTTGDPAESDRAVYLYSQHLTPHPMFGRDLGERPLEAGLEVSILFFDTSQSCNNCETSVEVFFDNNTKVIQVGWYNSSSRFNYYWAFPNWSGHHWEPYGLRGYGWHTFKWVVDQNLGIDVYVDDQLIIDDHMDPNGDPATTLSRIRISGGSDPSSYWFYVDDFYLKQ